MRLDDLQGEPDRDRRIERVAAALKHAHPDGGGQPMGRRNDPEGAADLGTCRKAGHLSAPDRLSAVRPGYAVGRKSEEHSAKPKPNSWVLVYRQRWLAAMLGSAECASLFRPSAPVKPGRTRCPARLPRGPIRRA